jgi:hypothetical protein
LISQGVNAGEENDEFKKRGMMGRERRWKRVMVESEDGGALDGWRKGRMDE